MSEKNVPNNNEQEAVEEGIELQSEEQDLNDEKSEAEEQAPTESAAQVEEQDGTEEAETIQAEELVESAPEEQKKKGWNVRKEFSIFFILLCVILIPILIANIVIIVKGSLHPNEIPTVAGYAPMAVITESMNTKKADAIRAGDLVVTKSTDPDKLKVDDVIMFKSGNSAVIHRIVAYDKKTDTFTTKGDANNTNDLDPVEKKNVIGKYVLRIPKLGDFVLFSKTPLGMGVCIGIPLLLLVGYDFIANRWSKWRSKKIEKESEE